MTRNTCVSAFICGSHICKLQPSEFDSIKVGPPSRPSTDTLSRQPSASIIGILCSSSCATRASIQGEGSIQLMDCRVKPGNDIQGRPVHLPFVERAEQPVDQGL